MTNRIVLIILILAAFGAGIVLGPKFSGQDQAVGNAGVASNEPADREILYWVAPMDPNFKRDKPGKSPMGMDLVPVFADEADGGDAVTINPAVENNLGVRTAPAKVRPLWRRVEATAYVDFDETRISHINTRVQGWIINLQVDAEGEQVSKGDLLFEFYSPELVNAQKEYLSAVRRSNEAMVAGGREKLLALGMIPSGIDALARRGEASDNIEVVAPQDGIITSLNVREGMYIQPNTPIMSLADLSSVWLQAEIFESQAAWVAEGQAAKATMDYMPGAEFNGQVDFVYPVLDPVTRTLKVRLRFDNSEERLKPNMYARVNIYGEMEPNALTIPREALIPAPGNDRVVVALGDGRFHVHEVMTGIESGEFVSVLAGIEEGDMVVTSAQFLIDSESSITGSIRRLESVDSKAEKRGLDRVFASGWVDEIDSENRRIRISHGPIDALGWPSMTMVFNTRPGVDLGSVKVGHDIRFSLVQEQAGEFVLEHIYAGSDEEGRALGESEQAAQGAFAEPQETQRITARATVRGVFPADHKVKLEHEPIEKLGWPSMTMNFDVLPSVPFADLRNGQGIHFSMIEDNNGDWVIDQIHVMSQTTAEEDHEHD